MQETRVQSLGWEDPLEKEMATPSTILAWEIPQTEEPGRLQSMGSAKSWTRLSDFTFTFPGGSVVKNPPANAGDSRSIPGSGRSPGGGNDNSLQYSCLENPMDRRAWQVTVYGVAKN